MNIHFSKRIIRYIAVCMSTLILSISIFASQTMTTHAMVGTYLTHIIDIALTKTGIAANYSMLSKTERKLLDVMNDTALSYKTWCEENTLDAREYDSWSAYLNCDSFCVKSYTTSELWKNLFKKHSFFSWFSEHLELGQFDSSDYVNHLVGSKTPENDKQYTISDEDVDVIRGTFDIIVSDEELGYYYIDTLSPSNVKPSWFHTQSDYNNFKNYIKSSDNVTAATFNFSNSGFVYVYDNLDVSYIYSLRIFDNSVSNYIVCLDVSQSSNYLYFYSSNWNLDKVRYVDFIGFKNIDTEFPICDIESFNNKYADSNNMTTSLPGGVMGYCSRSTFINSLFTKDGRKIIIFKTVSAMKNYLGGYREFYQNVTYDYSTSNDNSVTVGGDFLNNGTYSHDQIENNISNITNQGDTITEETINNITGDTITNITNNYYYGDSSGGSSSGGSSGGDNNSGNGSTIWDGLSTLVGGIGDLINFLVTLIGEILSVISNFFTTILELVGNFKDVGGDFVYFMSDFFAFVPPEIWEVIALGVTSVIGIAVWKFFNK